MPSRPTERFPVDGGGLLLLAVLATLGITVAAGFLGYSYDDGMITYRYAANLAAGNGLVFNPGEQVLGTSAPAYAVLLAALAAVTRLPVPVWGTLLAVGSLAMVAWVLRRALAANGAPPAVLAGGPPLFAASALLLRWNVELFGAEEFLVLALGLLAVHLALDADRPRAAAWVVAGAMLCRLDAALLAAPLGLCLWYRQRRFPWRFAVVALFPVVLFLGWLEAQLGTFLPTTLAAKRSEMALVRASYSYSADEWRWLGRTLPWPAVALTGALALGVLAVSASSWRAKRGQPLPGALTALVLAAWLLGHELAYRLLRVPFAPWYHVPLVNVLLALAALGAALLAWRLIGRGGGTVAPVALAFGLFLPVLVPSAAWVARQSGTPPDPRWPGYAAAAETVRRGGGGSVAAVEIGILGYLSQAPVLDLMGLVTPEAVPARQHGRLAELVAQRRPEWLIDATLFRRQILDAVLDDPRVAAAYRPVAEFRDGRHPGLRVRVLRRLPPPTPLGSTTDAARSR